MTELLEQAIAQLKALPDDEQNMKPNIKQSQGLYRLCYRLTNAIYPGWQYKAVELVRIDERSGNLYVLAGDSLDFEIKPTGGYEP